MRKTKEHHRIFWLVVETSESDCWKWLCFLNIAAFTFTGKRLPSCGCNGVGKQRDPGRAKKKHISFQAANIQSSGIVCWININLGEEKCILAYRLQKDLGNMLAFLCDGLSKSVWSISLFGKASEEKNGTNSDSFLFNVRKQSFSKSLLRKWRKH